MKTKTNTFVLTFATLLILLIGFGCADVSVNTPVDGSVPGIIVNQKYKASEPFLYNIDLTGQVTLRVENINGEVNVQSVTGANQVMISGEKIVSSDTYQDAYSNLKNITIELNELTGELLVKTIQPDFSNGRTYSVNYTISVPAHLSVFVKNVNGKLSARVSVPANGTVDMRLQNGEINLEIPQSTSAELSASLVLGSISTQNVVLYNRVATSKSLQGRLGEGEGTITLRTTNGNIDVSGF